MPAPEADPLLYTGHPLTYSVPYVTYHAPVCKTEFEEVKGQSCVTKPVTECNDVEVPSHKIVTEDVCQNVTTAECTHSTYSTGVYYGKREAEADPQLLVGAPYLAHATTKVTTKHCVPGAPIIEDITHDVTKCVPKSVCVDVEAQVPKTVCGDAAAEAEAVEEA